MTTFWIAPDRLVLASGSAARKAMLLAAGIPLKVVPATIDERTLEAGVEGDATPADIATVLARLKAWSVSDGAPTRLVLGADQMLALGDRRFHKAESVAEARAHLEALSGQVHSLYSGWALARRGEILASGVAEARMHMRVLTPAFLDAYLAAVGADVCTSVGGYKLEGLGVHLFERIEGDHTTVLGLPLPPVLAALRTLGYLLA